MSGSSLSFSPADTDDGHLQAYSQILSEVFEPAAKFSVDALAWRYRDNPAGPVMGMDAWAGDRLAAHYATCPTLARVGGRSLKGLLSLNTATHPDFQGQGLFTTLAAATYERAADAGYDFVMGVANENSTPGFLRRLGFQRVERLAAGLLARLPGRLTEAAVDFQVEWPQAQMAWRLANPAGRYFVDPRGGLTMVASPTHIPRVRCVALLPGDAPASGPRPAGLALSLFMGLEPRVKLTSLGFFAVPERLRPSPLNLIYKPLSGAAPLALEPATTAINFLDFDPY
jgi:GNAT superfamily N-acetyltransferase